MAPEIDDRERYNAGEFDAVPLHGRLLDFLTEWCGMPEPDARVNAWHFFKRYADMEDFNA